MALDFPVDFQPIFSAALREVPNALCLVDSSESAGQWMHCLINSQEHRRIAGLHGAWLDDRWKVKYIKIYIPLFAKSG